MKTRQPIQQPVSTPADMARTARYRLLVKLLDDRDKLDRKIAELREVIKHSS